MIKKHVLADFERYRNDPWAFLTECVYTKDPADSDNPVKQYPADLEYLRLVCMLWKKEKKLAIPKSRRMIMSWTMIPLAVWDCIFHKGKVWAFVSKKEDDSAELVERAEFVFNNIPTSKIPRNLLPKILGDKMTKSPPKLIFQFGSKKDRTQLESRIEGYPMGANQLRQFGFSGILGDEVAFWEQAEEFYSGAKPTLESVRSSGSGGGKMILISSRAPGFFKKVVFDQIDSKSNNIAEVPPAEVKKPMTGVELWRNPRNKFLIIDLHYTADPLKRSAEFREGMKASMPLHKFLREYERNWETFEGMPVYPNFRLDIHVPPNRPEAHLGLPLLFGWDFGLTPACILGQLQGNSLKVLREYTSQNEGIRTFAPKVMNEINQLYPGWANPRQDHHHFIDPAGFQNNSNDVRTCAQDMQEHAPIYNIQAGAKGNNEWESRKAAVEHFLLHVENDAAGMEIDSKYCPYIIAGFGGAYRYADKTADVEPDKVRPIKNIWSHPHDALQYLCWGARQVREEQIIYIPTPQYGFMKDDSKTGRDSYGRRRKG